MDKTELLNLITDEDIVNILTEEFGAIKGSENSEQIIFSSICHGSNSFKLYWYKTSKTFHCYVVLFILKMISIIYCSSCF